MNKKILFYAVLALTSVIFTSNTIFLLDSTTPTLPETSYNYANPNLPAHFVDNPQLNNFDNTPQNNPVTDAGAALGRVLFYDVNLSQNNTTSCASCHLQEFAFTDTAALSTGFLGGLTGRNSMSLVNVKYYRSGHFFWDERAETLEEQTLMPIQDEVEMGMTLEEVETKLATLPYYNDLFMAAFNSEEVTSNRISIALSQFVRSMVSYRSKYDEGVALVDSIEQDFPNFTAEENLGKALFLDPANQCRRCHFQNGNPETPNDALFMDDEATNNGVDIGLETDDSGVAGHTGDSLDLGEFKVSSLRNIMLTAPYMHDGRLATMEDVLDHYEFNIQPHPNLHPRLKRNDGTPRSISFATFERIALIEFFHTLTDYAFTTDVRWSNPFIETANRVQAKILLEGAYDAETGVMNTTLAQNNLIPKRQPFNTAPWNYAGNENLEAFGPLPSNIVDWVLVELRVADDLPQIVEQRAALLRNDGILLGFDGIEGIAFENIAEGIGYKIAIRTRNHIALMNRNNIVVPQTTAYDFTIRTEVRGGDSQLANFGGGVYAARAADFDANGMVTAADFNVYLVQQGVSDIYTIADCNFDGIVDATDYDFYLANASTIANRSVRY